MKDHHTDRIGDQSEEVDAMIRASPLACLSDSQLSDLAQEVHIIHMNEKTRLDSQGPAGHLVWLVVEGFVTLIAGPPEDRQIGLHLYGPGELLGIDGLMATENAPHTFQAVTASVLLQFHVEAIRPLVAEAPQLADYLLRLSGEQLELAYQRLYEVMTQSVEQRLARCIMRLALRFGRATAPGLLIDVPLSRQQLADLAGTRLETVSRFLSGWERDGIVMCQPKRVWIRDQTGLEAIAHHN